MTYGKNVAVLSIVAMLLGVGLITVVPMASASGNPGNTHGPVDFSGNWDITDQQTYDGGTRIHMLNGNVTVKHGGTFILDNASIIFTPYNDGKSGISVLSGGTFIMRDNSSLNSYNNHLYVTYFEEDSTVDLRDSLLEKAGADNQQSSYYGLTILTKNFTMDRVIVRDTWAYRLFDLFGGARAVIRNSTIESNSDVLLTDYYSVIEIYDSKLTSVPPADMGLRIEGGNLTMVRTEITNFTQPIVLWYSPNATLKDCYITGNTAGTAVELEESSLTMSGTIIEQFNRGIYVYDGTVNMTGHDTIRLMESYGIYASSNSHILSSNDTFFANTGDDIYLFWSTLDMKDGSMTSDLAGHALVLTEMSEVFLSGTKIIEKNEWIAIEVYNQSKLTMVNCTLEQNNWMIAIYVNGNGSINLIGNKFSHTWNVVQAYMLFNIKAIGNTYEDVSNVFYTDIGEGAISSENDIFNSVSDAFYIGGGSITIRNASGTLPSNGRFVTCYYGTVTMSDSFFDGDTQNLIYADGGHITSINSTSVYDNSYAFMAGIVDLGWHTQIMTQWQNGAGVSGLDVNFLDQNGTGKINRTVSTDLMGVARVDLIEQTLTHTMTAYHSPYIFSATKDGLFTKVITNITSNRVGPDAIVLSFEDNVPPVVTIDHPRTELHTQDGDIRFNGTASDALSGLAKVQVNYGQGWSDADGTDNWAVQLNLSEGSYLLQAKATDFAGNEFIATQRVWVDRTVPIINITEPSGLYVTNQTFYLRGTTEPGATVTVNGNDASNSNGNFSILMDLSEGLHHILAVAQDPAGNTGVATKDILVDSIPPLLTCDQAADPWTNRTNPTLSGRTDGYQVLVNGVAASVDIQNGTWEGKVSLTEGKNNISLEAVDLAGLRTDRSFVMNLDKVPPVITMIYPSMTTVTYTKEKKIVLTGTVLELNLVSLLVDGQAVTVSDKGGFTTTVALVEGDNLLSVKASDHLQSSTVVVKVQRITLPPRVTISSPGDGITTKDGTVQVKGVVSDVDAVLMYGSTPVTNNYGVFTFTAVLAVGSNTIKVDATDPAGNVGSAFVTVTYDNEAKLVRTSPTKSKVVTSKDTIKVSGRSEPGATIYINDVVIPVDQYGNFNYTLVLREGTTTVSIKAVDPAGNVKVDSFKVTYNNPRMFELGTMLGIGLLLMIIGIVAGLIVGKLLPRSKDGNPPVKKEKDNDETEVSEDETTFEMEEEPEEEEEATSRPAKVKPRKKA